MERKDYNGWTNYETWSVKLWMDNDAAESRRFASMAEGCYEQAKGDKVFSRYENARARLAEWLKDEHDAQADRLYLPHGFAVDLLRGALSEVNWFEIAENMLEAYADVAPTA